MPKSVSICETARQAAGINGAGMAGKNLIASVEQIESKMFLIRGQKVMLSMHLAELYDVEPRILVRAVKRNIERFPEDFMFQLNTEEFANLKSQIGISSWGGVRTAGLVGINVVRFKLFFQSQPNTNQ